MKRIIALLLSILLTFTLAGSIFAQGTSTRETSINEIFYNGYEYNVEQAYMIEKDNKRYLPMREIAEAIGYEVTWYNEQQAILLDRFGLQIGFQVGSNIVYYGGQEYETLGTPLKINEKVYMEFNELIEIFDIEMRWDSKNTRLLIFQKQSQGFLWKIEDEDNTVYLLGSVHAGDTKMYPIRDVVEKAFHESDYAVFEIDMTVAPTEAVNDKLSQLQTYQDGTTLKEHIPAETYKKLQRILQARNVPLNAFDQFQPWFVALQISGLLEPQTDIQTVLGVDYHFMGRSVLAQKPILDLETYLLQFEMFASFSKESLLADINAISDTILRQVAGEKLPIHESDPTSILVDIWKKGDVQGLEQLLLSMSEESYKKLLLDRHDNMLEKIEGFLASEGDEDYFVTVGALHTIGKDGLVQLLSDKGYKVVSYQ